MTKRYKLNNMMKMKYSNTIDTYELAYNCLRDWKRTNLFRRAILETVKKGDLVLDVGTGTGILSLFASRNEPSKIFALEISPYLNNIAKKVFGENKTDIDIISINGDASKNTMKRYGELDVVISELMSTGLISEMQVSVFNSLLRNGLITTNTKVIPCRYITEAQLCEANYKLSGFNFKIVQYEQKWFRSRVKRTLSDKLRVANIDFQKAATNRSKINERINTNLEFRISKNGIVNGLIISGRAFLSSNIVLDRTYYLNNPMIIPIKEIQATKGDRLILTLNYKMGGGIRLIKTSIRKVS